MPARPGENRDVQRGVGVEALERRIELGLRIHINRVAPLRPIDGNHRGTVLNFVAHIHRFCLPASGLDHGIVPRR